MVGRIAKQNRGVIAEQRSAVVFARSTASRPLFPAAEPKTPEDNAGQIADAF